MITSGDDTGVCVHNVFRVSHLFINDQGYDPSQNTDTCPNKAVGSFVWEYLTRPSPVLVGTFSHQIQNGQGTRQVCAVQFDSVSF